MFFRKNVCFAFFVFEFLSFGAHKRPPCLAQACARKGGEEWGGKQRCAPEGAQVPPFAGRPVPGGGRRSAAKDRREDGRGAVGRGFGPLADACRPARAGSPSSEKRGTYLHIYRKKANFAYVFKRYIVETPIK